MQQKAPSIARNLRITFSISIILLVVSLLSSFFSIQRLIDNSQLVNHTNEVLIASENVISQMKDGETGQRGFLLTGDEQFLDTYNNVRAKTLAIVDNVSRLTIDNPVQQNRCERIRQLVVDKTDQMATIIRQFRSSRSVKKEDSVNRYQEMLHGKKIMSELRNVVEQVKNTEKQLLKERTVQQDSYINSTRVLIIIAALISVLISGFSYFRIQKDLNERIARQEEDERKYKETSQRITAMESVTGKIAEGSYTVRSQDVADDEMGRIGKALNNMANHLQLSFGQLETQAWLQSGSVKIGDAMRGERNVANLSAKLLDALADYLQVPIATLYVKARQSNDFQLTAYHAAERAPETIRPGDGLAGQAIRQKKLVALSDFPQDYLAVSSTTGSTDPVTVVILPLVFEEEVVGLIELGMMRQPQESELALLNANMESIGIAVNAALDHQTLQELLEETQAQAEELQAQHSELESLNSELEAQAQNLQASEEELRAQQEELQQINSDLEDRTDSLVEKNREIEQKAEELAQSTRYKSEFLANMSHELRTPLNSILLLSRLLADDKTMSGDQVEYARVIQSSGNGLLLLIDEILDLSKIESGKMRLEYDSFPVAEMVDDLKALFRPLATEKNIELVFDYVEDFPPMIETDRLRLEQVLKNLLSNAIKFTAEGSVTLSVRRCPDNDAGICFTVKDTGIGIPQEQQELVFQAFQQADGSTKRKYGGTGLGLSISRELVKLLGGELRLTSEPGAGSEFIVSIPMKRAQEEAVQLVSVQAATGVAPGKQGEIPVPEIPVTRFVADVIPEGVKDDRKTIKPGDRVILIVEDDIHFAKSLLEFTRKKEYKGVVSVRGDEAISLARKYKPAGILLDIHLPVKSGWEVMDDLKKSEDTRHIPVHIMSSYRMKKQSLRKGAVDFIEKPVAFEQMQEIFSKIEYVLTKDPKKVLIIEDNPKHAEALSFFLASNNIQSDVKTDVSQSVEALRSNGLDCVILDMGVPSANDYKALEAIRQNEGLENLPIIIFTGRNLSQPEEQRVKQYVDTIVVKTAHSYQRVLDEVSLFLHLVKENGSGSAIDVQKLGGLNEVLDGKTVLIADDDIRNIFSLSKVLEELQLKVITSMDGKEALEKLEENPHIDIVLLDMMMPEMDGYETARHIRSDARFHDLPIIAVTAKAMMGDREKCISAGASDYITKPVDLDQLLSLLRVWLYDSGK